ncbi:MAG: aconitate hydratase [Deltaproteobacteria bacterium]|nr:aconitate hydratase [Deltaproteobacteria bacterium]
MGLNATQKIIKKHLVEGRMKKGNTVAVKIDQTLTQDATGTMAYLQFEAMGIDRVKTELSVSYVDHNTLQTGFENADDHRYLQSVASRHGVYFSRPGNGICHQVHLERFGAPGKTLLGSDSHTPTGGGIGMMAMGAGGLDVALAMAGQPFRITMPEVVEVKLTGKLQPWVSAKDVILELLRRETVKGGVNKVYEYTGEGVESLTVPERATITNMGAELGATTSIFPSDNVTKQFMKAQGRVEDWSRLKADPSATYDKTVEIDLDTLEPMIAKPHMPDNVVKLSELEGTAVQQVAIGSCTNSSYRDLMTVAGALKGKTVHPNVSLAISPGSKQVMNMLSLNGALADLVAAGARILESTCGPCIGMGQSPSTDAVSLRTFNRNFLGRSGTKSAQVHLVSPEVAIAAAITGEISDPRKLGDYPEVKIPKKFLVDDNLIIPPAEDGSKVEVLRGPNIAPCPSKEALPETLSGEVLLKAGDNITTDHIMPAGAKILPLRSNVPKISEHVFEVVDPEFPVRAKEKGGGFVVGGANYGQGSSREHAALAPMYLGVKAVITKSFARIHLANLINFGIIPLTFVEEGDYDKIDQGDVLELNVKSIKKTLTLKNKTRGESYKVTHTLDPRAIQVIQAGGSLSYAKASIAA